MKIIPMKLSCDMVERWKSQVEKLLICENWLSLRCWQVSLPLLYPIHLLCRLHKEMTLPCLGNNKQRIPQTSEIMAKTNKKHCLLVFSGIKPRQAGAGSAEGNQGLEQKSTPPFPSSKKCVFLMVWKTIQASLSGAPRHCMTPGCRGGSRPSHKAAFVSCSLRFNSNLPVCFPSLHPRSPWDA